jgi:hypothetical protein
MPDQYTDYVDTSSREPLGDSEGYIQPEESAVGFSYKKRVLRQAFTPGNNIQQTLTGQWEVFIYAPGGTILFHQIVTFRLLCVFDFFGGVTFIPLDNGGKFQTMIVDGQPVPQDADGNYEGWRFVDTTTPTSFVEFGIPIFKPDSGAVLGGLFIDVDWQGPRYKMNLPAGAVLKEERDEWRQGTDIPIAFYQVSIKPGASQPYAFRDPATGQTWMFATLGGKLRCGRTRRIENYELDTTDPIVFDGSTVSAFGFIVNSDLWALAGTSETIYAVHSMREGKEWGDAVIVAEGAKMLAAQIDDSDGSTFYVLAESTVADAEKGIGVEDMIRLILKKNKDGSWTESARDKVGGDEIPKTGIARLELSEAGAIVIVQSGNDVRVFRSTDGMKSFVEQGS